jgi:hypothetical protein
VPQAQVGDRGLDRFALAGREVLELAAGGGDEEVRVELHASRKRGRRFPCVTHVTIQNEVNGEGHDLARKGNPGLSRRFYELLYRHLDAELRKLPDPQRPSRTLRAAIKIIAGDLVERKKAPQNHQDVWLKYMHANMEVPREASTPCSTATRSTSTGIRGPCRRDFRRSSRVAC